MFQNRSAWFSCSVPRGCRAFWVSEGGAIDGWRTADFLFSQDATCPDTLRIFVSSDYLRDKVTIFHSRFLSTCEKRQSVKSVCIGHYVLPPLPVQDEVRSEIGRFIWEFEDERSVAQASQNEHGEEESNGSNGEASDDEVSLRHNSQDCPVRNTHSGYISMDALRKYSGDLRDFHPKCLQCCTCDTCRPTNRH